jgi:inner membrane protein COX18
MGKYIETSQNRHNKIQKNSRISLIQYQERTRYIYQKYDCHPLKSLIVPAIQIPLFMSMTFAIRNLTGAKFLWFDPPESIVEGIQSEGFLFLQDLSLSDPTLISPIIVSSLHLINVEVQFI